MQTKAFNNTILDIFGFTGYSEEDNAIIVVFRSTVSIQNWIVDLDATEVHRGEGRSVTPAARVARFIKDFTMLSWEWRAIFGHKFKK